MPADKFCGYFHSENSHLTFLSLFMQFYFLAKQTGNKSDLAPSFIGQRLVHYNPPRSLRSVGK